MQINFREFNKAKENEILNDIKSLKDGLNLFDKYQKKQSAYVDLDKQYNAKRKELTVCLLFVF